MVVFFKHLFFINFKSDGNYLKLDIILQNIVLYALAYH